MALSEGMSETLGAAVLLGTHLPKEEGQRPSSCSAFISRSPVLDRQARESVGGPTSFLLQTMQA